MAVARVFYMNETNQVVREEQMQVPGTSIDEYKRAARTIVTRTGAQVRSVSASGNTTVVVYAYDKGQAPKDLGAPPGWTWRPPTKPSR